MGTYKLKIVNWVGGVIDKFEQDFDDIDDAINETKKHKGLVKIYNEDDEIVHSIKILEIEEGNQ